HILPSEEVPSSDDEYFELIDRNSQPRDDKMTDVDNTEGRDQTNTTPVDLVEATEKAKIEIEKSDMDLCRMKELLEKITEEKKLLEEQVKRYKGDVAERDAELERLKKMNINYKMSRRTVTLSKEEDKRYLKINSFGFLFYKGSICSVAWKSPAEFSGVKRGDEIVSIDGVEIEGKHERIPYLIQRARENGACTMVLRYNPEHLVKVESPLIRCLAAILA
ncbi:hypothetical protein PENTCL1PPCAC_10926, partial [Pristionchus entomophagus]